MSTPANTPTPHAKSHNHYEWIRETAQLTQVCELLKTVSYIAIDTEFERTSTYWPILSLVQISCSAGTWLLDCLSKDLDLHPFKEIFLNPTPVKVFHGARQDLEIFHLLFKALPHYETVFDTQVAAMACFPFDFPSYERLCQTILRVSIDKSLQRTNWLRRPLSEAECLYAARDVTYLCLLYEALQAELTAKGRTSWAEDEMQTLLDEESYRPSLESLVAKLKMKKSQKNKGIVAALVRWREEEARARNVPREHVIKGAILLEIANRLPKTAETLFKQGLPEGLCPSHLSAQLLDVITQNFTQKEKYFWKGEEGNKNGENGDKVKGQMLKLLAATLCKRENFSQHLLSPNQSAFDELASVENALEGTHPLLSGWRHQIFGKEALKLMKGTLFLGVKDNDIALIER